MTISFIGAASAEATSIAIPTHQKGDRIILFAERDGTASTPTVVSDWVACGSTGVAGMFLGCWSKIASNASEVSGTWTSATFLSVLVYRATAGLSIGSLYGTGGSIGAGDTANWAGISAASISSRERFLLLAIAHRSNNTDIEVPPAGFTFRTGASGALGEIAVHGSAANTTSTAAVTRVLGAGTTNTYRTLQMELVEIADPYNSDARGVQQGIYMGNRGVI